MPHDVCFRARAPQLQGSASHARGPCGRVDARDLWKPWAFHGISMGKPSVGIIQIYYPDILSIDYPYINHGLSIDDP